MIITVDNAIPKSYQDDIEQIVLEIPYYYSRNTSYSPSDPLYNEWMAVSGDIMDNGQFTHAVLDEGVVASNLNGFFTPLIYMFAEKANIKVSKITRIKVNLMLKDSNFTDKNYNHPHSDGGSGDKVFLYYVNDSDGDTFLFEEFDNGRSIPDKFTIAKKVSPVKGTGVFFDTKRFHASSNPSINKDRFVINFNFI